ncbi:MAG: 3-methyl-2-oxobutanoate dehydrogenase subunit beta, partial [Candidatus Tectomicrobia bacterium]|nr:3-methyl-2-oxobutanoate dehydrogenase subunit beta [Candidatus Tectomicrobia bacterium]
KNIVLAPWSVQETYEMTQLAYHLADQYRNPVILLSDGLLGQMVELLEFKTLDFGPLPPKDWCVQGRNYRPDGTRRGVIWGQGFIPTPQFPTYLSFIEHFAAKTQRMKESEVRYETHYVEDAELIVVAYGSSARISLGAVEMARAQGIRAGLVRPITLWPFPSQAIRKLAEKTGLFLTVEDSQGQMIDDVEAAVAERAQVHQLGMLARHEPTEMGMLFAERVLEEIKRVL